MMVNLSNEQKWLNTYLKWQERKMLCCSVTGKHMAKIQFRNNDTSGNGQIAIDGTIPMWAEPDCHL